MTILLVVAGVWILSIKYAWRRMDRDWVAFERYVIKNDEFINAIGQIPRPITAFVYGVTAVFAPFLVPAFALDHYRQWRGHI